LQETANAVTVLSASQLDAAGVYGLNDLQTGLVPSLRAQPSGSPPTALFMSIRGFGPTDAIQTIRETSVAVYKDGFYIGRAQGLGMEMAALNRIEVFRGPQGTMFGRNATGGAVNFISEKPTGKLGFRQMVSYGNLDALRTLTRLNLAEFSGIRISMDYIHSEREGWVKNSAPDQADFNAYNKDSGGLTLSADITDTLTLDYDFDLSHMIASQIYFQLGQDNIGLIGVEPPRVRETRFPITPFVPSITEHQMHSLTLTWEVSKEISVKSLTSYRKLDEDSRSSFAGALYFNGLVIIETIEQDQWTQELQVIGSHDRVEWVAGLYYFEEDVVQEKQDFFSLDIFGILTGTPLTPIVPPTKFNVFAGADVPLVVVKAKAKSTAIYGQVAWTPPVLDDKLVLTFGLRYTDDSRDGRRIAGGPAEGLNTDENRFDPLVLLNYHWTEHIATYAKWSTAFKAGGASFRSVSFAPYNKEKVETFEIGLKSEFLDRRLRINAAIFSTNINDAQIDFFDPLNPTILETFNAANEVEIDGAEIEISMTPAPGLVIGLNYTYLDGNMPLQPNPLAGGALTQFNLAQTPEHAGSLTVDYSFEPFEFGTLMVHVDVVATDEYHFIGSGIQDLDSYALINARLTLSDISIGGNSHNLRISLWGKNLADTKYLVFGIPLGGAGAAEAYGTPRTYGLDLTYQF